MFNNISNNAVTFNLKDLINKKVIIEQVVFKSERKAITYAQDLETGVLYILDIIDKKEGF